MSFNTRRMSYRLLAVLVFIDRVGGEGNRFDRVRDVFTLNRLAFDLDFCTCMGRSPGIEYHRTHAVYIVSQNNIATALSVTSPNGQMFTDFQNSFTVRLSNKFAIKSCLKISPRLDHVATVPCEIYKFKNRHAQGVSAAKCRVRLCHSKTVSKHVSGEISSI